MAHRKRERQRSYVCITRSALCCPHRETPKRLRAGRGWGAGERLPGRAAKPISTAFVSVHMSIPCLRPRRKFNPPGTPSSSLEQDVSDRHVRHLILFAPGRFLVCLSHRCALCLVYRSPLAVTAFPRLLTHPSRGACAGQRNPVVHNLPDPLNGNAIGRPKKSFAAT